MIFRVDFSITRMLKTRLKNLINIPDNKFIRISAEVWALGFYKLGQTDKIAQLTSSEVHINR
jgi:hypothetical protein